MDILEVIDQGTDGFFQSIRDQTALHPVLIALAYVGDYFVLLAILLLGLLVLGRKGDARAAWLVLGTTVVACILTAAGKLLVDRPWPNPGWTALQTAPWERKSFPSGYALLGTVIYGSLGILLARRAAGRRGCVTLRALSFVLPLLAGAGRLFIRHSYLSDVLAGWAVGAVLVMFCVDRDRSPGAAPQPAGGTP
jgi:undecaprenyl-diphosphatase